MAGGLVVLIGLIYAGVAIDQALKGAWPTATMFFGYAFSNIGIYLQVR